MYLKREITGFIDYIIATAFIPTKTTKPTGHRLRRCRTMVGWEILFASFTSYLYIYIPIPRYRVCMTENIWLDLNHASESQIVGKTRQRGNSPSVELMPFALGAKHFDSPPKTGRHWRRQVRASGDIISIGSLQITGVTSSNSILDLT